MQVSLCFPFDLHAEFDELEAQSALVNAPLAVQYVSLVNGSTSSSIALTRTVLCTNLTKAVMIVMDIII